MIYSLSPSDEGFERCRHCLYYGRLLSVGGVVGVAVVVGHCTGGRVVGHVNSTSLT